MKTPSHDSVHIESTSNSSPVCSNVAAGTADIHSLAEIVARSRDLSEETREFYRWFEGQWHTDGTRLEENPPTRFLLNELDERGERLQKMGLEAEHLRERLLEREVRLVRLTDEAAEREKTLSALRRDFESLEGRYRLALQSSSQGRRKIRELEQVIDTLRQQCAFHSGAVERLKSQIEHLVRRVGDGQGASSSQTLAQRLAEAERHIQDLEDIRRADADLYRELFAERDNRVHALERELSEKKADVQRLQLEIANNGGLMGRLFGW